MCDTSLLNMAMETLSFPINSIVMFHSYISLQEGKHNGYVHSQGALMAMTMVMGQCLNGLNCKITKNCNYIMGMG